MVGLMHCCHSIRRLVLATAFLMLTVPLMASLTAMQTGCEARSSETPKSGRESVTPVRPGEDTTQLSGSLVVSVSHLEKMLLPDGSTLRVTLSDVSKADAPAEVVAEQTLATQGSSPFVVTLTYDPAAIQNRSRYAVSARIEHDGKLLFITDTNNPALTGGAPKERVEVVARRAQDAASGG